MSIIDKPSDYFNTKLYTGNGGTQSITGVGFQPDWVWIKNRSSVTNHEVADSVRGVNKLLKPNDTDAEQSLTTKITSFDSDGFGVGTDANVNGSGNSLVSWNWKAGTSFTNDASATGIGTIDSAGSVNQDAGFSIVSYTSTSGVSSIKHGLNTVPSVIILKTRAGSASWFVGNASLGWDKVLFLNLTNAVTTDDRVFSPSSGSDPTSSIFYSDQAGVASAGNMIAYCFAEKQGYSKFGSYTGNGNADGTFVYTGFKPALFLLKANAAGENWRIFDNKRSTFNPNSTSLQPNSTNAEASNTDIDFCSNGIKLRTTSGEINPSGTSFIYMAFAEESFVSSTGVCATAR